MARLSAILNSGTRRAKDDELNPVSVRTAAVDAILNRHSDIADYQKSQDWQYGRKYSSAGTVHPVLQAAAEDMARKQAQQEVIQRTNYFTPRLATMDLVKNSIYNSRNQASASQSALSSDYRRADSVTTKPGSTGHKGGGASFSIPEPTQNAASAQNSGASAALTQDQKNEILRIAKETLNGKSGAGSDGHYGGGASFGADAVSNTTAPSIRNNRGIFSSGMLGDLPKPANTLTGSYLTDLNGNGSRVKEAADYTLMNGLLSTDSKFLANVNLGRISQDESRAWTRYMLSPTEENRKFAQQLSSLSQSAKERNADALNRDDGVASLITEDLARYVPQLTDQLRYEAIPMVLGAAIAGDKGMKVGRVIGSTAYSMETMSGAAFKNLLDAGIDEETARKAARNEAILSTIIESADEIVDMFTTGFGKAGSAIFGTPVKGFDALLEKFVGESTWKKWAVRLGKYGLNIGSEANEEGSQEAISIANEQLMSQGKNVSLTELAMKAVEIYIDAIFNRDSENRERIGEAAAGGARLALINMPMESAGNAALSAGITTANGQQIRNAGLSQDVINEGLYNDEKSRAYQLAERLQQAQNQSSPNNRLQEIARQMQNDYRLGQLNAENNYAAAADAEAEELVRSAAWKAASGETVTNTEVAGILDNDIAVQELEQVSGQEIASLRRSQRPAAVRSALEAYARNTETAQNMTRPLQMNEYSGVTGRAGKTANLDVTRALQNIASSEQGQRISAATNPVLTRNLNALSSEGSFRPDTAMYRRMQRYNASPNWDNLMLVQASDMLSDSREGAPAMVASWNEGQDVAQYAREFTQYYNAGVRGSDINEVGDISRQVLTQDQRETAYLSGVRDAAAGSRQENSDENLQSNTENQSFSVETEENTAENVASGSGSIADTDRIEQEVNRSDQEWSDKLASFDASPNWNNDRLNDYANVILDNGAGTSGYMTMVGDWNEGQNEGRYAQEFTSYYNAGIQGSDISAVGNIANQILTQQQREDAYIAGRHDALTGAVKEAISEFEEAGSQVLSEEGNGGSDLGKGVSAWKGADRKGEAQRIARQQRNEAARIRTDAETEGLRSVSADELNIPNGTIGKTMKVIPESSSLYTDDMRRIADRMKRLGKEVRFFIGEIECFDPWTRESFRSNGATFGNEVWVRADDETFRAEDIAKHEEYHILKANYKDIQEEIAHAIIRNHDEAELNRLMRAYARDYKGLSADDIMEEICADAYAGMERYYLWSEGTQGATQYTGEAQEAGNRYYEQMAEDAAEASEESQQINHEGDGVKYSLQTLPDGTKYVLLDGNIFFREDGTEMTPREAYRWLVNNKQQIRTEDGEIIDFATGLPNISTMAELFKAYPFVRGFQTDKKALNTLLNKNIIVVFEFSRGLSREIEDRSARHNKMGIKTFDTRHLIVSDGANAYDLELTVANLKDGRKIAYKKTFISLNKDVTEQIQKAPTRVPNPRVPSADNRISSAEQSVNTTETKFSISSDSVGRQLSEEQQEFFKDSKVRDADGNLKVMYHGTQNAGFTVFDPKKARSGGTYGRGFYFSDSDAHAGQYGDRYEVYLNIKHPMQNGTNEITKKQLRAFIQALADDEDYGLENYGYGATVNSVLNDVWGKTDFEMLRDLNMTAVGDFAEALKIFNQVNGTDYDGIIAPTETVAFRPEQIKKVDNSQPTSSPDIRFSRSSTDSEGRTLSEAQQEFFKDSKIRDEEGNLMVVYHGTDQEFTVFDPSKGRANMDIQGMFFSPWDIDAEGYGPNVKAYYLNIKRPADERTGYAALNRFKGQNNAGIKAREYLVSRGYDGVNNSNEEFIAFYPEQIKLIDNQNPTSSPDIRFSKSTQQAASVNWSTAIEFDPSTHTQEEIDTFNDYLNSVDQKLLQFVKKYYGNNVSGSDKIRFTTVGHGLGKELKALTGYDFTNHSVVINQSHVQHLANDHGVNGSSNHTMANIEDVARIGWVINNADSVDWSRMPDGRIRYDKSFWDKNHDRMLNVEIRKKIDNTYLVVLATGETKTKELNVVTAYLEPTKKGLIPGIPNTANTASGRTSITSPTSISPSTSTVSQGSGNVNTTNPVKTSRASRYSQETQREIQQERMDLESKLNDAYYRIRGLQEEKKELEKTLSKRERDLQITKERNVMESSLQRVAGQLLKEYDVLPGKENEAAFRDLRTKMMGDLEKLRNIVLNVNDPEVYERILRQRAVLMADDIIKGMRRLVSTDEQTYQSLKSYLKTTKIRISEQDKADLRDFNNFRKRNMGRLNLTNNGTPVDTVYQELREEYGVGYFPEDITHPADQLERIEEIMQTLEPVYEGYTNYEMAEAKEYLASDIENRIIEMVTSDMIKAQPPTVMDKVIAKYEARFAKMEKSYQARLDRMAKENQDKINRILDREKTARSNAEEKIRDYYKVLDAERRARKYQSDARTKLLNVARRLSNKKLPTPNKERIQQLIGDLDLISKGLTHRTIDKLSDLRQWYDTEKATNPDFIPDPRIEAKLARLSQWHVNELSIDEVQDLTEVLLNIENEIRTQRHLIEADDKRDIYIQGEDIIRNVRNSAGRKDGAFGELDKLFVNGTLSPTRALHRMTGYVESDPLYRATNALADGQRKMFDFQMRAGNLFTKWTTDSAFVREISGKHAKEIEIRPGIRITEDMRMSLYMHLQNDQNLRHVAYGGVTIPDMKLYKKGKIAEAYNKGQTIKLTKSEVEKIVSGMSEKEKAFCEAAKEYFGSVSQKAINATSELLKGYSLAEVKNYFPINTDKNFTRADFETLKMDGTIEGMGFLKERVEASNPIMLRDMSDVLKQSIEMTGKYVGLAIPVRNFNKLWNVATGTMNEKGKYESFFDDSVKQAISKKWGEPGLKYIEKMMTDLQNGRKETNDWGRLLGKIRSNYAQAVLTLNLSVAMKQAASYPTAGSVLGWKPLLRALADFGSVDTKKINEYTPLLWYRTQGFSTQELGDMKARGMQLPKALNWVQGMDVLTTRKLWKASEYYIRDNRKDLEVGSEDYYKAVAEIYNRVIEETQPNYTTMQRPQLLRSDDTLLSSLMMFKTQPFQNFNILYDSIGNLVAKEEQYKNNKNETTEAAVKQARRDAANAITSQVAQLAVFAGMTFAWAMFRGKGDKYKDEDKMTIGSVFKGIGKDMIGNLFSSIPFGADAWEFVSAKLFGDKYYGFDVAVASSIEDLLNAFTKAGNAVQEIFSAMTSKDKSLSDINWTDQRLNLESVLNAVGKIAGVPIENVQKLFEAIFRNAAHVAAGRYEGEYAYLRLTTSENKYASDYYNLLWKAYKNDQEAYQNLYSKMIELEGLTPEKISNAMERKMKEEQGVTEVSELEQRFLAPDQQAAYDAMLDPIEKSGLLSQASEKVEDKALARLYEIAKESTTGQEYQEKMDALEKKGIDNSTWLLYQLAKDIANEQNDNNKGISNEEKEAAIRMLNLTRDQSYELWQSDSKASTDENNPWK